MKHEDLAVSGKKFVNLDWKLKSALDKKVQNGEVGMMILQATEEEAKPRPGAEGQASFADRLPLLQHRRGSGSCLCNG